MEAVCGGRMVKCIYKDWRLLRRLFPAAFQHYHIPQGRKQYSHCVSMSQRTRLSSTNSQDSVLTCRSYQLCGAPKTQFKFLSDSSSGSSDKELVYTGPLNGAVRAVKIFSLTTAVGAACGGPVLALWGNPSVPLAGRLIMSSLVMLVGLGTTAVLHWIVKGYVMKMAYDRKTGDMTVHTLSMLAKLKSHHFNISEAGPPPKASAFSTFQARGKPFFMHTEVFQDRVLLSRILGAYSVFEDQQMWAKSEDASKPKPLKPKVQKTLPKSADSIKTLNSDAQRNSDDSRKAFKSN